MDRVMETPCAVPKGWVCFADCGCSSGPKREQCYHRYVCPTCGEHPDKCKLPRKPSSYGDGKHRNPS